MNLLRIINIYSFLFCLLARFFAIYKPFTPFRSTLPNEQDEACFTPLS